MDKYYILTQKSLHQTSTCLSFIRLLWQDILTTFYKFALSDTLFSGIKFPTEVINYYFPAS